MCVVGQNKENTVTRYNRKFKKKGDGHTKPKKKSENDFVLCHFHEKHTHTHALTKNELNPTNNFSLFVLLKHTKKEIFKKIFTG